MPNFVEADRAMKAAAFLLVLLVAAPAVATAAGARASASASGSGSSSGGSGQAPWYVASALSFAEAFIRRETHADFCKSTFCLSACPKGF